MTVLEKTRHPAKIPKLRYEQNKLKMHQAADFVKLRTMKAKPPNYTIALFQVLAFSPGFNEMAFLWNFNGYGAGFTEVCAKTNGSPRKLPQLRPLKMARYNYSNNCSKHSRR